MRCFFQTDCLNSRLFHKETAKLALISKMQNTFCFWLHKIHYYFTVKQQNLSFSCNLFPNCTISIKIVHTNSRLFCITMTKLMLFFFNLFSKHTISFVTDCINLQLFCSKTHAFFCDLFLKCAKLFMIDCINWRLLSNSMSF